MSSAFDVSMYVGITCLFLAWLIKLLRRRHVNDSASTWAEMWRLQVQLGTIPYYMFVERDTGATHYFAVPLAEALSIYSTASSMVSGLARTARGPSMSTSPGKICVLGVETVAKQKVFMLKFVQSRNPSWSERVFFAEFDESAVWFDQLRPAFGEKEWFFEKEYEDISARAGEEASGQMFQ